MLANTDLFYSSVPTHNDVTVPETLLKKRKSQEKAREERSAELAKKKTVGQIPPRRRQSQDNMMHNTIFATRHYDVDAVA